MSPRATLVTAMILSVVAAIASSRVAAAGAEVSPWMYPRGGRDPLIPPAALYSGQDLPSLRVTLIGIDSHHRGQPLAVVRIDSRPPVRQVVRPGDRVGPYRILQIRPESVRVAVPSLGGTTVLDIALRDSTPTAP